MSNSDQNKPSGKRSQRKGKGERSRKPAQQQGPKPDHAPDLQQNAKQLIDATIAKADIPAVDEVEPVESLAIEAATPASLVATDAIAPANTVSADAAALTVTFSTGAAEPADAVSISLRSIADAYGDYARKSCEYTTSFVERLKGVRSLNEAMELQAAFATQAYETFLSESQRICEIYRELASQSFKPLVGLVVQATHAAR
jgi:hypothetical protein